MAETLGHIRCGGVPMAIGVQTDMATPALARFGSRRAARASSSRRRSPATSSPASACPSRAPGSDVASIRTTARTDGDDYVINGGKMWITNGVQADWMCLLANTSDGPRAPQQVADLRADEDARASAWRSKLHKIGMNSSDTAQIHFDDVRVPQRYRIGEEGQGFTYQMQQFQEERLWAAANALQGARRTHRRRPSSTRASARCSASSVLDNQVVHFTLAELKTEVEALRALDLPRRRALRRRRGRHASSRRWPS